jgi:II/X family phage/plasmid replication protein
MIDTIKFEISGIYKVYEKIAEKSMESNKIDNEKEEMIFRYFNKDIPMGVFNYSVNLFSRDANIIYIEYSAPKIFYGHNVWLIDLYTVEEVILKKIHSNLEEYFEVELPHYSTWTLQRLDLCYAWKFPTDQKANEALDLLRVLNYPRKKTLTYDTSITFRGSTYTVKFYLKGPEYLKKDYKRLREINEEYGDSLISDSKGLLRYEVTIRKKQLVNIFHKKKIYFSDINNQKLLIGIMNQYLKNLLKYSTTAVVEFQDLANKIKSKFPLRKARRLIEFHQMYYSDNPAKRNEIINNYSRATIWRYKRDLAQAEVGVFNQGKKINFDFSISIMPIGNENY